MTTPLGWLLPLTWVLVSILVVIFFYDVYHFIIPDRLVVLLTLTSAVMVTLSASPLWWHVSAATGAAAFFGGLWLVSKGRWIGLGDAKLAFPLALLLSPLQAFSFVVLSFWIGAFISVGIIGWQWLQRRGQRRLPLQQIRLTMKSEVPFAPFIIASFLIVYFGSVDILLIVEQLLP